ncbi:MAG: acetylglutamate kinase [Ignavibacteria bacterium]|nr:acetylglutamate kinase [Ignavibacteria bacterium]
MKSIVIKLSGKALSGFFESKKWSDLIKYLQTQYEGVLVVHGAGTTISDWSSKLGCPTRFYQGQRVTTAEILDVVAAVQSGLLNQKIIASLAAQGCTATGLSGVDRNLFVARYIDPELGFVGYPELCSDAAWINELMSNGIIPVFSSLCRDENGNLMNVNADIFCEVLAEAIHADTVLFISDVQGVRINGAFQQTLSASEINAGISSGEITDGMIPKLQSCIKLLTNGINRVWIGADLDVPSNTDFESVNMKGTWIVNHAA